jgi:hypothetical protein
MRNPSNPVKTPANHINIKAAANLWSLIVTLIRVPEVEGLNVPSITGRNEFLYQITRIILNPEIEYSPVNLLPLDRHLNHF